MRETENGIPQKMLIFVASKIKKSNMSKFIEFKDSGFSERLLVNTANIVAVLDLEDEINVSLSYKITDDGAYRFTTKEYTYEELKRMLRE